MINSTIDNGKAFDWGRASKDYAKYRDIYPASMYEKLYGLGIGNKGDSCLDIGTGTGVLPRHMYKFGAHFTGMDIAENQVKMAKALSAGKNIEYFTGNSENLPFKAETFDCVTAVQCWRYFNKDKVVPEIHRVLKPNGILAVVYMQWLPTECAVTGKSFALVKKYNPQWNAYSTRIPIDEHCFTLNGFKKLNLFRMMKIFLLPMICGMAE